MRTWSSGRSRTGRVIIPAWQKRQPRVQPRNTSTFRRSCTTSVSGTSWFFGYGQSARSAIVRFSTRSGTSCVLGRDRHERGAVVGDVVHRRHVHTRDPRPARAARPHATVAAAPADLPRPHDLGDLGDDLLAVTEHDEVEEVGERLGVVRAVAAGADERVFGPAVGGPDGHPGQVDAVEHVRVDELGRQVEREQVEVGRRRDGCRPRTAGTLAGAQLCFEVDPGGVGPLRHRIGALVQDLVEDLQALVGQADLVGVRVNEQPGDFAGAVLGTDRTVLEPDVASGFLDLGQQGFELWPEISHFAESYRTCPSSPQPAGEARAGRAFHLPGSSGAAVSGSGACGR